MENQDTGRADTGARSTSPRQRAIDAYESARERTTDTLAEAPLIALAGGIAAGALIAALLPRTQSETRLVRPTARRVKTAAGAAYQAARETGSRQLDELGINRAKGEETIRSLFQGVTDAAKASASAALDAARKQG
ncbi:MAG TPA: hypothetical protein VM308_04860 [Sphingomicrobium sp.]|nr:hypothetical protein [Sphingomicrobium sp.]